MKTSETNHITKFMRICGLNYKSDVNQKRGRVMKAVKGINGSAQLLELPDPSMISQFVKVRTQFSVVSVGTELMMISNSGDANLGYSASGTVEEVGEGVTHVVPGQRVACYGVPAHREVL